MTDIRLGTVDGQSVLGRGCQLYRDSEVRGSTLHDGAIVGDRSRVQGSTLEAHVKIDRNNLIQNSKIGRLTFTGNFCVVQKAKIGSFCSISWGVTIGGGEHDYDRISTHDFLYNDRYGMGLAPDLDYDRYARECVIGHDVWIAANATVLRGVRIGNGAVIGANALVSRDIPDYAIAVGNPARVVKYRFAPPTIDRLQRLEWWSMDLADIRRLLPVFSSKTAAEALEILEAR